MGVGIKTERRSGGRLLFFVFCFLFFVFRFLFLFLSPRRRGSSLVPPAAFILVFFFFFFRIRLLQKGGPKKVGGTEAERAATAKRGEALQKGGGKWNQKGRRRS
jgi:hypothetical protein